MATMSLNVCGLTRVASLGQVIQVTQKTRLAGFGRTDSRTINFKLFSRCISD
jgi:hypothetical protein